MPTVLITDHTFSPLDIERAILEPLGLTVVEGQLRDPQSLAQAVAEVDYVITQFAPVNADVVRAMSRARVIVRYGIGVDNVDLAAARERGIPVCNVPDYCLDEVADHTLAFILAATRQVLPNCLTVRAGRWQLAGSLDSMRTLRQQTVGVVGCGRIGREVLARLAGFGCRTLVFDPGIPTAAIRALGAEPVDLETLLTQSDIITLHCPSTESTRGMINSKSLAKMKRGAILVNLARGDLVETDALVSALDAGQLAGAALDVCAIEPILADSPLVGRENVILSAHVASASVRAVAALRQTAAETVARRLRGESLANVVNGVGT